jgi:hypothetical protein
MNPNVTGSEQESVKALDLRGFCLRPGMGYSAADA